MTSKEIEAIVARELAAWQPPVAQPGTTVGVPWPAERYGPEIDRLRAALVSPYRQSFVLRESDVPEVERVESEATYWVIADTGQMYVWYDDATSEFGVGEPGLDGALPVSVGLRGDIVGSFCAW
jgi:hypothetical protein